MGAVCDMQAGSPPGCSARYRTAGLVHAAPGIRPRPADRRRSAAAGRPRTSPPTTAGAREKPLAIGQAGQPPPTQTSAPDHHPPPVVFARQVRAAADQASAGGPQAALAAQHILIRLQTNWVSTVQYHSGQSRRAPPPRQASPGRLPQLTATTVRIYPLLPPLEAMISRSSAGSKIEDRTNGPATDRPKWRGTQLP